MNQSEFSESTKQLLRPDQIKDAVSEQARLKGMLSGPDFITNAIQNKAQLSKQLQNITRDLDTQKPQPYKAEELDAVAKREVELRTTWLEGMPTEAEMRKGPPHALQKNIAWEKRNKQGIMEWKTIRRRLNEGGDLKDSIMKDVNGVSNVELFRPKGGAQEGNMHNALIPGQQFHMPEVPKSVVFNDSLLSKLEEVDPELAKGLSTMSSEVRAQIKEILTNDTTINDDKENEEVYFCAHEDCNMKVKTEGQLCNRWHKKDKKITLDQE